MYGIYEFRAYPNADQCILIDKTFSAVRFIHNKILDEVIACYKQTGKTISVTPDKYIEEFSFLKKVDSFALINEQCRVDESFENFTSGKSGMPKFMSKEHERKSYTTSYENDNIRISGKCLVLPKVGKLRIAQTRDMPETI